MNYFKEGIPFLKQGSSVHLRQHYYTDLLEDVIIFQEMNENMYECLDPSSDCDTVEANTVKAVCCNGLQQRRSEGSMDTSPDYIKFRRSFMRSTSLPYCGSETESDIYSPYSFYGSEDVSDISCTSPCDMTQCIALHITVLLH
jgi:hypothetical protein